MEPIHVYSTQARDKVPLKTIDPGRVRMYVCGPTVYDRCHIGHARPAVCFDTIRRYLEYAGYAVTFISNITDIDDKIIARANELGTSCERLAQRYQDEYERDMAALGVRAPTVRPKATEHIPDMIALVRALEDKGVAYRTDRGVWFDVSRFPDYGKLSGRTADDETVEHRVEQDPDKRHAQDFALWKASKPGEPAWDSPWGAGRPGWHIECSAMSGKYCDFQLDIHGGGSDLTFPHHENEIAQSEAATGRAFVRYWMHNGFVTVVRPSGEEEKMGKSKGNAFWLHEVFAVQQPAAVRLWILGTHYRAPLAFHEESLRTAAGGLDRIYNALDATREAIGGEAPVRAADAGPLVDAAAQIDRRFRDAMNDDFNTPRALAAVHDAVGTANRAVREGAQPGELAALRLTIEAHLTVLGLPLERPRQAQGETVPLVDALVRLRNQAREAKQYAIADQVRGRLAELGIELKDGPEGTTWVAK